MFTQTSLETVRAHYADEAEAVRSSDATDAPSFVLHRARSGVEDALRQSGHDEQSVAAMQYAAYGVLIGRLAAVEEVYLAADPALVGGKEKKRLVPSRALPAPMDQVLEAWSKPVSTEEHDAAAQKAEAHAQGRKPTAFVRQPWQAGDAAAAVAYTELQTSTTQNDDRLGVSTPSLNAGVLPQPATE